MGGPLFVRGLGHSGASLKPAMIVCYACSIW